MDQRFAKILQSVSIAMLAWYAFAWTGKLHRFLAVGLFLFVTANLIASWMVSRRARVLRYLCYLPVVRQYLRFICSCMREPYPIDSDGSKAGSRVILHTADDFATAGVRAKQIVRGHDGVIDRMLTRLHENVTLRRGKKEKSNQAPLASFLLVGSNGIGKLYLARVVAKLLNSNGDTDVFDCTKINVSNLIGTQSADGALLASVRKSPARVVVFEDIENASSEVSRLLLQLLTTGKLQSEKDRSLVSFRHVTVICTTTAMADTIGDLDGSRLGEAVRQQKAIELLAAESRIDPGLLHALTEVYACQNPDDLVKSEVVALLMQKECHSHQTKLAYVEPAIVATQVLQIEDSAGFEFAPQLIQKLMRKPLVAAVAGNHKSLSLRIRSESV